MAEAAVEVAPGALVCEDAQIVGDVRIGEGCVVHPTARIRAEGGPIVLGAHCAVEEKALLLNASDEPMVIGDFNLFEVGCEVRAASMGDCNVVQPRGRLPEGASVGNACVVGCGATVAAGAQLQDGMVVFVAGEDGSCSTRVSDEPALEEAQRARMTQYLDLLRDPQSQSFLGHFHEVLESS